MSLFDSGCFGDLIFVNVGCLTCCSRSHFLPCFLSVPFLLAGTVSDIENVEGHASLSLDFHKGDAEAVVTQEYALPAKMGILQTFTSPSPLTALDVIKRIMVQREQYQRRYDKKAKAEGDYVANKTYVQEG